MLTDDNVIPISGGTTLKFWQVTCKEKKYFYPRNFMIRYILELDNFNHDMYEDEITKI